MEIHLAPRTENTDNLSWKQLKTSKKHYAKHNTDGKCLLISFHYPVIIMGSVIKSPNRLTPLGNADCDCHKDHIHLGNNSHAGKRDLRSIHGLCSIIPQSIIHGNLHNCHGNLINAGRHPKRYDHLQIPRLWYKHTSFQIHLPFFAKIIDYHQAGYHLTDHSCRCCTFDAPVTHKDK